jgi:hypothetical protein
MKFHCPFSYLDIYQKAGILGLTVRNVAGKRGSRKKQTICVLTMRQGRGWQSREMKLKELKHEGHIHSM